MLYGWAYDWPNGSTVYPPLFDSALVGDSLVGENKSRVKDTKLDAMMKAANAESNPTKQAALWVGIDKYITNTIAAVVPFYQGKTLYWNGSNVGGIYYSPMAAMDWANVYLKDPKK
jgi:peptide/nickel transport system substrate-binding protein